MSCGMKIGCSLQPTNLPGELLCENIVGCDIVSNDPNIDRRGRSHVQYTIDQTAGGIERLNFGNLLSDRDLHSIDITAVTLFVPSVSAT